MSTLHGKRVWITGASSGIGEALAVACRTHGSRLVVSARNTVRLSALVDRLVSLPADAKRATSAAPADPKEILAVPLDIARPEQLTVAVDRVNDEAGPVDIIIHAAGVSQRASGIETEMNVVRQILETNFFGVVALTRELIRSREAPGGLHVVVLTSSFGKFGAPERSAYAASKHALHGYFDSLRTELPRDRFRITLVVPGIIATNIATNALRGDGTRHGVADETIARGMSPARCAATILRAVERNREEVYVATDLRLRIVYLLKKLAPRLLTRILTGRRVT